MINKRLLFLCMIAFMFALFFCVTVQIYYNQYTALASLRDLVYIIDAGLLRESVFDEKVLRIQVKGAPSFHFFLRQWTPFSGEKCYCLLLVLLYLQHKNHAYTNEYIHKRNIYSLQITCIYYTCSIRIIYIGKGCKYPVTAALNFIIKCTYVYCLLNI